MNRESLVISDKRVIHKIPFTDIIHVESKGMQSNIHTSTGAKHSCCKNMGEIIKLLEKARNFFRVHTSHTVNLNHISKANKARQGQIVMSNGSVIPVSKRRKSDFFKRYLDE